MFIPTNSSAPHARRFRPAGIPPELHRPKLREGAEFTSLGQKNSGKMDFMAEIIPHLAVFLGALLINGLLGISTLMNSGSDSERFPLQAGRDLCHHVLLSPHTTQVCFCDIILQSAHKHHPGDTLGGDGKSKLILSAICCLPPQTDLLRDEKKKVF